MAGPGVEYFEFGLAGEDRLTKFDRILALTAPIFSAQLID